MLTESEFTREWRRMFGQDGVTDSAIKKGDDLVERLPLESPLRARYDRELNDLRKIVKQQPPNSRSTES